MKNKLIILVFFLINSITVSIFSQEKQDDNPVKNFEFLCEEFNNHYALFEVKNINWDEVCNKYRPMVNESTTNGQLFSILCEMLKNLNDGHVSITNEKEKDICSSGIPARLLSEFPTNSSFKRLLSLIDSTLIKQSFRDLTRIKTDIPYLFGNVIEYTTSDKYGYLRVNLMYGISENDLNQALDDIVLNFENVDGVIIDVRFNSGGYDKYSYLIAGRFADKKRLGHYKSTKGKSGFSEYETWYIEPTGKKQIIKPVIILSSNLSMSATDVFALAMRQLPYVTIIGDTTKGIFSDMYESKLPNGWNLTLSHQKYLSADRKNFEDVGIPPDIYILNTKSDIEKGIDPLLIKAIDVLNEKILFNTNNK